MASTIVKKKKNTYTYENYANLDDDKRYELIEGELLMTPLPTTKHQRVLRELEFQLKMFVSKNNIGEFFFAPFDVYLDDINVVQPDIMYISKDRLHIITEKNIQGAPCLREQAKITSLIICLDSGYICSS